MVFLISCKPASNEQIKGEITAGNMVRCGWQQEENRSEEQLLLRSHVRGVWLLVRGLFGGVRRWDTGGRVFWCICQALLLPNSLPSTPLEPVNAAVAPQHQFLFPTSMSFYLLPANFSRVQWAEILHFSVPESYWTSLRVLARVEWLRALSELNIIERKKPDCKGCSHTLLWHLNKQCWTFTRCTITFTMNSAVVFNWVGPQWSRYK